jgi:hypothetical protein
MPGFKPKVIKNILRRKVTAWANSITDESVRALAMQNTIVSGGAIASMLLGEKPNDYDLYFRDNITALAVAKYYAALLVPAAGSNIQVFTAAHTNILGEEEIRVECFIKSLGAAEAEEAESDYSAKARKNWCTTKFRPVFISSNAITLSDKVQLITRFAGAPDQILRNYDFAHCMCYYDLASNNLVLPADALEALLTKTLIYKGSLYPIASVLRLRKFIARGWRISAGQVVKMVFQMRDIDFNNHLIMMDQLLGVDATFMHNFIKQMQKATQEQREDLGYVANLLDKVFGD